MEKEFCPKVEKCPIFLNNVLTSGNAAVAYKKLYCEAGAGKYQTCMRYKVSQIAGKCPPNLLPNSNKRIEDVLASMAG